MCFSHCNCLKFRIKETAAKPENKLNLIYYKLILWIGKQQIMNNLWQKQIFKYFFTIRSLYSVLLATLILINSKNILTPVIFMNPILMRILLPIIHINNLSLMIAFMTEIICQTKGEENAVETFP